MGVFNLRFLVRSNGRVLVAGYGRLDILFRVQGVAVERLPSFFLEIGIFDDSGSIFRWFGRWSRFSLFGLGDSFFPRDLFCLWRGFRSAFLWHLNLSRFGVNLFRPAFVRTVDILRVQGLRTHIACVRAISDFYAVDESVAIAIGEGLDSSRVISRPHRRAYRHPYPP